MHFLFWSAIKKLNLDYGSSRKFLHENRAKIAQRFAYVSSEKLHEISMFLSNDAQKLFRANSEENLGICVSP